MVKIVQFLQLSAKFLAILRQSVSPIETLFQDFTHRLGFHMGLHFWGGLCFQGGLWSSVFILGVFVFITTICITCNQPHIFVDNTHKSATIWFTRWALFAVKWVAIIFSLDCSKFLNCLVWFWQTQTLLKHSQLDLHKHHDSLFFISFRNMVCNVFWTGAEYNYAQCHCLDLDLWLANFKICHKIFTGWPRFV